MVRNARAAKGVKIYLRIPGPWRSPAELDEALKGIDSAFRLAGEGEQGLLVNEETGWKCECDATSPDDQLAGIFAQDGRLSKEEIDAIANHAVKVHLTGAGGSIFNARAMMEAGAEIVKAGASGVMVDNSGVCHSPDDWLALAGDPESGGVFYGHVITTRENDGTLFSAGMHCLGYRDADLIDGPDDKEKAWFVLNNFLAYSYRSGVKLKDGDVTGYDAGPVKLKLKAAGCTRVPDEESPFFNPYGVWILEPAE